MAVEGFTTPGNAPNAFGGGSSTMFGNVTYPVDMNALAKFGGWNWGNQHAGTSFDIPNQIAAAQKGARLLAENMNLPAVESVRNKQANTDALYKAFGITGKGQDLSPALQKLLGMGQDDSTVNINSQMGQGGQGDYNQLYNQLQAMMNERGGSYENDIKQSSAEARKTAAARMMSRGLGGSTLVDASNARIKKDENAALNKLHDTLLGQDIGTLSAVGIEGLKARQRQQEFAAQMKLANSNRGMQALQMLLGGA